MFPFVVIMCLFVQANFWTGTEESTDVYDVAVKRYLGILAKNNELPKPNPRSPFVPPLMSGYENKNLYQSRPRQMAESLPKTDAKRHLGALAKSGDLNFSKPQQKKNDFLPPPLSLRRGPDAAPSLEELSNPIIERIEFVESLRPLILEYISEIGRDYDPKKVDLFLENLSMAVFGRNEEFTMDDIRNLVESGYFQRDETFQKRNIQSLVRDFNVSYSGMHSPHSRQYRAFWDDQKRFDDSITKTYNFPKGRKRYEDADYDDFMQMDKRDAYDVNENVESWYIPPDYYDYEGREEAMPIGKRYIGAMARSGWLPHGFNVRTGPNPHYYDRDRPPLDYGFNNKRHIGALARMGWFQAPKESRYYFRGGRTFRPPAFNHPRSSSLKSAAPCSCKRDYKQTYSTRYATLAKNDAETQTKDSVGTWRSPQALNVPAKKLVEKRYLLLPAVDKLLLRRLYPQILQNQQSEDSSS